MKEWAEADNQSKNLPKSERQALNEVNRHFSSSFVDFVQNLGNLAVNKTGICPVCPCIHPLILFPPAFPDRATDGRGASRWGEAEACGDASCQS